MMTIHKTKAKKQRRSNFRFTLPALTLLFCMGLLLRNPNLVKEGALEGFRRSVLGVLPAVFPFLVFAELLTMEGGLPKWMSSWLCRILRLSPTACSAILLGWICGFPVGALCAARELETGRLCREDAERAIAAASVPSPAFLIGAVGNGLLQNPFAGGMLWVSCLLAAGIVCVGSCRKRKPIFTVSGESAPALFPFTKALTTAVRNAAQTSLNLCSFISFFSVLITVIRAISDRFGSPVLFGGLAALAMELSSGAAFAATVSNKSLSLLLLAAGCGWSGLSVHFQIFSVCAGMEVNYKKYLLAKAFQALLCTAFAGLFLPIAGRI